MLLSMKMTTFFRTLRRERKRRSYKEVKKQSNSFRWLRMKETF
jgi:hypothetical protein